MNRDEKHIVIVEDDPWAMKSLKLALGHFKLTTFFDGKPAYEYIKSTDEKIDAIITDNVLPGTMDGWALAHLLKKDKKFKHIPIVMESGKQARFLKYMRYIDYFLEKPFTRDEIYKILNQIFKPEDA